MNLKAATHLVLLALLSTVPLVAQLEPSREQYKVYSDFLRIQLEGKNGIDDLRVGKDASTVSPNIAAFAKRLTRKELHDIEVRLPGVEADVLKSLAGRARRNPAPSTFSV